MNILFADFETTGFARPGELYNKDQPYIVQMALALRVDGKERSRVVLPVKAPVESDPGALEIHGLERDYLRKVGMEPGTANLVLHRMLEIADLFVSHNVPFDQKVAQISIRRYGDAFAVCPFETGLKTCCTMGIAKLLMATRKCNLDAACRYFLNMDTRTGYHNAGEDLDRCMALYDYFMKSGVTPITVDDDTPKS